MDSSRVDRVLRQVLLVPLAVTLLGAAALYWQVRRAGHTVEELERADAVIAHTTLVERLLLDRETGLRGYQATGDARFLDSYLAAYTPLTQEFQTLRRLEGDQAQAVWDLQAASDEWERGFALKVIRTLQAGRRADDPELNLDGKRRMDGLREKLAMLRSEAKTGREHLGSRWREQVHALGVELAIFALATGLLVGLYMWGLVQDVSAAFRKSTRSLRVRAEQAYRSEQRLRTTLASIGDGVISCDEHGAVLTMNPVACKLTGWPVERAAGRPLDEVVRLLSREDRTPVASPLDRAHDQSQPPGSPALDDRLPPGAASVLVRPDGTELFIEDSAAPVRDRGGRRSGTVLVLRDVTLAIQSREALIANEKLAMAGRLAATIAHEIHNPLDAISNLLFLMDGPATPEEAAQFLTLARQETERVTQISRAMLGLYRESREPARLDLKVLLESVLLLMEGQLRKLDVRAQADLPQGLIVQGFGAEIRQVFTNLIANAAEASPRECVLDIRARPVEAELLPSGQRRRAGVVVDITDCGPGIETHVLDTLFRPFITTKGEKGTGLGLWVSRGILSKHGGSVMLTSSTEPGRSGTTASVFLAAEPVFNPGAGS